MEGGMGSDDRVFACAELGNGAKQAMISTFQFWLCILMSFTKDGERRSLTYSTQVLAGIITLMAAVVTDYE